MILEVKQVSANGKNSFEITNNGALCYEAQASWLPMVSDSSKKIVLNDAGGSKVFETKYHLLDNALEQAIPLKYLVTQQQKFDQYQIVDASENEVGAFYLEQNKIADIKLCLSFGNRFIVGYKRSLGKFEAVSFYEDDVQVGQLTKSNSVVDNLDVYYVHFLDEYEALLPVIAMFTVYYDYLFHNNSGQIQKGTSIKKEYTYDRNNKKYNPDFIAEHFGVTEGQRITEIMNRKVEMKVGNLSMKTFWLIFGIGWGVALLIAAIVIWWFLF